MIEKAWRYLKIAVVAFVAAAAVAVGKVLT